MFLVDEVFLGSHDGKVVLNCARVILWVEVNLAIIEGKSISESESGSIECVGEVEKN